MQPCNKFSYSHSFMGCSELAIVILLCLLPETIFALGKLNHIFSVNESCTKSHSFRSLRRKVGCNLFLSLFIKPCVQSGDLQSS